MQYKMFNQGLHTGNWEVEKTAADLVNKLINGEENIWYKLLNIEVFSALFCKRNETLLRAMRWCFQEKLVSLCQELNSENFTEIQKENKLNRHLCNLPLAEIKPGQEYLIPTFNPNTNKWILIPYKVAPIELTPTYGLGRLVLADDNRLFAYGFTPMKEKPHQETNNFSPPPRLVFISPEYPAQQGFLANKYLKLQSISGFYKNCEKQVVHWLSESTKFAKSKATVHAIGNASRISFESIYSESSQHIAKAFISDVYRIPDFKSQKKIDSITVQMHKKHYNFSESPTGWMIKDYEGKNIATVASKWYFNALIEINVLSTIANIFLVMPCQYLLIPLIRAILHHKTELALLSILTMVFIMLPGLVMTDIGTTLAVFTAVYFGTKLIEPLKVLFNMHEKSEASCHKTDHTEENELEEYRNQILSPSQN